MNKKPICEKCGYDINLVTNNFKNIRFYKRYSKALCDECVDKLDGTWDMQIYTDENNRLRAYYPYKQRR